MKRNFYIRLICFIIAIISVGLIVLHMYHLAFSYAMKPNMQGLGVMLGLFGSLGIVAIVLWVEDLIIMYKLLKDDIKNNYTFHEGTIDLDIESGDYYGKVLDLPKGRCVTYSGSTFEECEEDFINSVDDYIANHTDNNN